MKVISYLLFINESHTFFYIRYLFLHKSILFVSLHTKYTSRYLIFYILTHIFLYKI